MANLFEIDRAILECIDMETGELIDPERLEALNMERNQKIENVALWVKNLQSDALAYKAEKDAFAKREKEAANKVEALKKWLAYALSGEKFTTEKCAVSFRRSTVVEIDDETTLPADMVSEKITITPNKDAIKVAIKNGQQINGCRLVDKLNTQIK